VDPHDTSAFNTWYDVFRTAVDDGRPYAVGWTRDEMRVSLAQDNPYRAREIWSLRDSGEVVAGLMIEVPLADNTSMVSGVIGVRADVRRRGHGRAMGRLLDERAAEHGRTIVTTQVDVPLPPAGGSAPRTAGQAFAAALGFSAANFEVHRVLDLPLDGAVLDQLAAKAAERHQGYELRTWRDRCPDDLVDRFAELLSMFLLEAPVGELELEAERWDAARIRQMEEQNQARGRHSWTTVAIAPDGTLAGYSELHLGEQDPVNVFQSGTLVAPAHRGHRLGLGLKARNHLELQQVAREPMVVHTWNGEQNTAMNAVNGQLGYRPVELQEDWQRRS
jgi:GNAT superfamily N-acetyltransferase